MNSTRNSLIVVAAVVLGVFGPALADPLPGGDLLKFSQQPLDALLAPNGVFYYGHDEPSTAYGSFTADGDLVGYKGSFMADDFADEFTTPVVHVTWWGSYGNNDIIQPVDKFLIAFESDVPTPNPVGFSYPDTILSQQVVTRGALAPGSGTFTEVAVSPGGAPLDETLYKYNAELAVPFDQLPDTVYWLKIVALVDLAPGEDPTTTLATRWGWHDRDWSVEDTLASAAVAPGEFVEGTVLGDPVWHFQDDAVSGEISIAPDAVGGLVVTQDLGTFNPQNYISTVDGPDEIDQYSKDLAFELYTIPEPATVVLLAVGSLALWRRNRRAGAAA